MALQNHEARGVADFLSQIEQFVPAPMVIHVALKRSLDVVTQVIIRQTILIAVLKLITPIKANFWGN